MIADTTNFIFENKFKWSIGDTVVVKYDPKIHFDDYEYIGFREGVIVSRIIVQTSAGEVYSYGVNITETDIYEEFSESELDDCNGQ